MWLAAFFACSASAAESLSSRLLAASDEAAVETILSSSAPSEITTMLFDACEKSARAQLDRYQNGAALREFRAALAVARRLDAPRPMAAAWLGIGISESRMRQFTPALEAFSQALPFAEKSGDKAVLAHILRARGTTLSQLGRFPESLNDSERSLAVYREIKDNRGAAMVLNNRCEDHRILGNLRLASTECEESWHLGQAFPDLPGIGLASLGPIAALQGNFVAARDYMEEALRLQETRADKRYYGMTLLNVGSIYRELGDTTKALSIYERALALTTETGDVASRSMALINRAGTHVQLKHYPEAIADLREALRLRENDEAAYESALAYAALSLIETYEGQTEEACRDADRALVVAQQFQSPDLLWKAWDARGTCQLKRNPARARNAFQEAVRQIESLRASAGGGEQEGQLFLSKMIDPYRHMVQLLLDQGDAAGAFSWAERARARQLLDTMRRGKTQPSGALSAEELREEERLSAELTRADRRISQAANASSRAQAWAVWEQARAELESFRGHLYALHPGLAAARGDAAPLTVAETAALLPSSRALLVEFAVLFDEVAVFTIERGPTDQPVLKTYRIAWSRAAMPKEIAQFREALASRSPEYRDLAARIYARVLGPFASQLQGKDTLVVVPDESLWNLPFQALVAPDGSHLLERHALFYAPSLTFLREGRRQLASAAPGNLLALGNPASAGLPNAKREVLSLARLYGRPGAVALTGERANKRSWIASAPEYRVLHLATHGVLNPANPMYSWLALAQGASGDALEAREILGMNLHADLAVLSACETARGKVLPGEGLVGMSWAFLAAGTRNTVVSQWKVDSAGTTDLMLAFHRNLKQGTDSARSLQKAVLETIRNPEYRHPFYWAGFVMIGNGW
jgi:CHAT domain-containing protein/Tfp pilus assembly protein PilF